MHEDPLRHWENKLQRPYDADLERSDEMDLRNETPGIIR